MRDFVRVCLPNDLLSPEYKADVYTPEPRQIGLRIIRNNKSL